MTPERNDPDLTIVDQAIRTLSEHFDAVQVFATRYEGGKKTTIRVVQGEGNYWARKGMVEGWITEQDTLAADGDDDEEADD